MAFYGACNGGWLPERLSGRIATAAWANQKAGFLAVRTICLSVWLFALKVRELSSFPIIATILSMVLGLSVTRLLLGLVTVFRIRRTSPIDWVPLVWALVLFETQLEYWWAINQLPSIKPTFTFQEFIFLVLLSLALFLSAALLLPSRSEDEQGGLRLYFERDGRYALLSYSAFLALGFVVNVFFLKSSVASGWAYIDIIMMALPIATFFAKSRNAYAGITLVYLPLAIFDTVLSLSP